MKKTIVGTVVAAILLLLTPMKTWAEDQGGGGFMLWTSLLWYQNNHTPADKSTSESLTRMVGDYKAGYEFPGGLYLGLMYGTDSASCTGGYCTSHYRSSYGPTIGYFYNGFYGEFTYHFSADDSYPTDDYKGTGYQLDFGYRYMVSTNFYLGPQITYQSFTYTQDNSGGTTTSLSSNQLDSHLEPELAIGFIF